MDEGDCFDVVFDELGKLKYVKCAVTETGEEHW